MTHQIDDNILLATVRIQAALRIASHIVGPKEAWAFWMRDNLTAELNHLPKPNANSPHPRLLGSLDSMPLHHYTSGVTIDTLCFEDIHAYDLHPVITQPGYYVDVSPDALPELKGGDFWWQMLPSSVSLRVTPPLLPSKVPLELEPGSSKQPVRVLPPRLARKLNLNPNAQLPQPIPAHDAAGSKNVPHPSNQGNIEILGTTSTGSMIKGKAQVTALIPQPESEDPEASKKTHYNITGKAVVSQLSPLQNQLDELIELRQIVTALEKQQAANKVEREWIMTEVANLEFQLSYMKAKLANP
ncbi:hypothetical protein BU15DRAFT_63570 [Melanogaster broomeanus]|nr:hypothetical protein BU15DRAFT_63570 [Melanogaster broomeanus]